MIDEVKERVVNRSLRVGLRGTPALHLKRPTMLSRDPFSLLPWQERTLDQSIIPCESWRAIDGEAALKPVI